jgi:hypothetical protein
MTNNELVRRQCQLGIAGGWLCFVVSILIIGILTALIGDLATHVSQ